jgi:hypothetical protein
VVMNTTRNHMGRGEDCSKGCRSQAGLLDRKINQVLLEVLVESEWILWSETAGKITTASGKTTSVSREGQVVMEDGLRVWAMPTRVGGVKPPRSVGRPCSRVQ